MTMILSLPHLRRGGRRITQGIVPSRYIQAIFVLTLVVAFGSLHSNMREPYIATQREEETHATIIMTDAANGGVAESSSTALLPTVPPPPPTPLQRPHRTKGFVHYRTTSVSGWNNQRQGAMVAWVIAYLTGYTLQYKTFHPANTGAGTPYDRGGYAHADLWDPTCLERYVTVQNISHTHDGSGYEYLVSLETVFASPQEVRALASRHQNISYDAAWSFAQHTFPWLDPWQQKDGGKQVFERLVESFTYSPLIQKTADDIVEKMGGGPFIGLHVRDGRKPALSCQKQGVQTINVSRNGYERGGCVGIDWNNVIPRIFPNSTLPIYLAHDGKSRKPNYASSTAVWEGSNFEVLTKLRPAIISAVEQEVMVRAESFIASTHSSWSEYVIYKRALTKQDGKENYMIWKNNTAFFI
uniref:Uncharacterized protein n=1 Tax=Amphora coffeiformis TaxID=265554 RepID=A0A7S3P4B6_9STRA